MDKRTFGHLVMENEVQLYRIAKSILQRDEDCADAAQEAVTKAFEKLDTLCDDRYAKTWLIRILINTCYDLTAKRKKEIASIEQWIDKQSRKQKEKSEDYSNLYEALHMLEAEFRVILTLHYMEGFRIQEISKMLDIPVGTVKSRLYRGREKMKIFLSDENTETVNGIYERKKEE